MTPEEPLTKWQVQCMIIEEIDKYDVGNERRHGENSRKMDRLLWWLLGTFATVSGVLILQIIRLALGK